MEGLVDLLFQFVLVRCCELSAQLPFGVGDAKRGVANSEFFNLEDVLSDKIAVVPAAHTLNDVTVFGLRQKYQVTFATTLSYS